MYEEIKLVKPNRVVLITVGMSPAIVTETLYALHQRDAERGHDHPNTVVRMLTTANGAERVVEQLIDSGGFKSLIDEIGISYIEPLSDNCIVSFESDDIRTSDDVLAMSNRICEVVKEWVDRPDWSIHASIAGGRKPMGMQIGFAMSMLGRSGDELSHVLTSPERPDELCDSPFLFPSADNRGSSEVAVNLIEVPILLLNGGPLPQLGDNPSSYEEMVQTMNALFVPEITFDLPSGKVIIAGREIKMQAAHYAVYAWVFLKHVRGEAIEMPPSIDDRKKAELRRRDNDGLACIDSEDGYDIVERNRWSVEAGEQVRMLYDQLPRTRGQLGSLFPFPKLVHTPQLELVPCLTKKVFEPNIAHAKRSINKAIGTDTFTKSFFPEGPHYAPDVARDRVHFVWTDSEIGAALLT